MRVYPIDPLYLTQRFGENPDVYRQFGLAGHNGWDFRTGFSDTPDGKRPVIAPFDVDFYANGDEGSGGYGKYLIVTCRVESIWQLTFGHLSLINAFSRLSTGATMAISDNTGFSTGPHLHLTTKRGSLVDGKFTTYNYDNGFKGAVDPEYFFQEVDTYLSEHGNIVVMDPYEQKGIKLLEDYRKVRTTAGGQEGNWEAFASSIIASDKALPGERTAKESLSVQVDGLNAVLKTKEDAITSMQGQIGTLEETIKNFKPTVVTVEKTFTNPVAAFFYKLALFAEGN